MIDPIDGTVEFIAHVGECAVMIGLAIEGTPSLGVIYYQPTTEKLYYAASDTGTFLETGGVNTRLRVSSESNPSRMTIALNRSHRSPTVDLIRRRIGIGKHLTSGSLGLKVGLICEGRADLYLHMDTRPCLWDTCAPEAILREAGGQMTDLYGSLLLYVGSEVRNPQGVIVSNGVIHNRIVETARTALGEERVSARTFAPPQELIELRGMSDADMCDISAMGASPSQVAMAGIPSKFVVKSANACRAG